MERGLRDGQAITEIRLSHFSVKEWLLSDRLKINLKADFKETAARATIAVVCVAYLLELNRSLRVREMTQIYPFAEYSARYWASHAAVGEETAEAVTDMAMELFSSQVPFQTSIRLNYPDEPWRGVSERFVPQSTLCFAARQGEEACNPLQTTALEGIYALPDPDTVSMLAGRRWNVATK